MLTKITKRTIDQLKPRQSIADSEVKGFRARCLPSGSITYEFRYRNADGRRQFVGLGLHGSITADQARALAKKRAGEVADSRDPAEERRTEHAVSDNTVNVVLDDFMRRYVEGEKKLRSIHDIRSAFDRLVRPQIGDKPIADVRPRDIVLMLDHIADNHGLAMADRTLAIYARHSIGTLPAMRISTRRLSKAWLAPSRASASAIASSMRSKSSISGTRWINSKLPRCPRAIPIWFGRCFCQASAAPI